VKKVGMVKIVLLKGVKMTVQGKVNAKMEYAIVWKDFMANLVKEDRVKTLAILEEYVLMEDVNVTKVL
jgi:hypothetical protein